MAESWTISVGGRVYGPYNLEQMQGFHAENRLADHSMVARAGEEQFHPASENTALALLFQPASENAAVEPIATEPVASEPAQPHRFGARTGADGPAHFVIVADMKSRSITGLEEEIFSLGQAHRFGPQSWVLSSEGRRSMDNAVDGMETADVRLMSPPTSTETLDDTQDVDRVLGSYRRVLCMLAARTGEQGCSVKQAAAVQKSVSK